MSAATPAGAAVLTAEQIALKMLDIIGSPGGLQFIADKVKEWEQLQGKVDAGLAAEKPEPPPE